MKKVIKAFSAVILIWMGFYSAVFGATSNDYYNAGLQFYNSKSYDQAIQYFSAALSMDPNNAAALQGRANCYYSQGRQSEALADYQKALALNPSDAQLSQFVQSLQAQVGGAPAVAAPVAASSGALEQGVALYQQQQYQAAIPQFQQAVRDNPNNANAYYYLGMAQVMTGDSKNAAVAFSICNQKQPNPTVEAYVNQLKSRLLPEDQQWVAGQVTASSVAASAAVAGPSVSKKWRVRLQPAFQMLKMTDFENNAQGLQSMIQVLQSYNPTYTYTGEVPQGALNIGIEPAYSLMPNLELGLRIAYGAVGKVTNDYHNDSGVTYIDSYDISSSSAGLNLRYKFGEGSMQPFVCLGGFINPIMISYSANCTGIGLYTGTASGDFGGIAAGGLAQLGLDWLLGDTFSFSPFVSYQVASGNDFSSTIEGSSGGSQKVQLQVVPTETGNIITLVSDGRFLMPVMTGAASVYAPGDPVPTGTRPLEIDLSGLLGGIQISMAF